MVGLLLLALNLAEVHRLLHEFTLGIVEPLPLGVLVSLPFGQLGQVNVQLFDGLAHLLLYYLQLLAQRSNVALEALL